MKKMRLWGKWGNQIHIGRGILRILLMGLCITAIFAVLQEFYRGVQEKEPEDRHILQPWLEQSFMDVWMPGTSAVWIKRNSNMCNLFDRMVMENFPVLLFSVEKPPEYDVAAYKESDYEELLILEGSDENRKEIAEESLEYGEDAIHLDKSLEEAFLAENEQAAEPEAPQDETEIDTAAEENPGNAAFHEVEEPVYRYQWETLQSYEDLVKAFYAIDSTTTAGSDLLDMQKLLSKDMRMQGSNDKPQILIYHTHSQEAFVDSVEGDESTTIVGAGEKLAQILHDNYGYHVIHHTESYDKESRDYSYSNALPAIEALLYENPSIELVIDLHRDEMPADKRLVVDLQGRPTAQYMFFNGLSRTAKNGVIESLENPYLEDNLALSLQMQIASNEYYPGIARRVYLKAYRYNMHLCPKSLLIELGAQNNTVEEIKNAIEPLAHVIHLVLSGEEPDMDF